MCDTSKNTDSPVNAVSNPPASKPAGSRIIVRKRKVFRKRPTKYQNSYDDYGDPCIAYCNSQGICPCCGENGFDDK